MGECGSRGDGRVWEQEKREDVWAGEMVGCEKMEDGRVWRAGEMGACGSRGDGRLWEQGRGEGVVAEEMGG